MASRRFRRNNLLYDERRIMGKSKKIVEAMGIQRNLLVFEGYVHELKIKNV